MHYVEGCTAPMYTTESLHSAVVEIIVKKHARCRYTTIQNWANNIYNLVTKRAMAYEDATMEWIDGNLGSRLTMKYPAVYMMEPGARGEILSIAFARQGPASGRRRQGRALRPEHQRAGSSPSGSARTAAAPAIAAWCKVEKGAKNVQVATSSATP